MNDSKYWVGTYVSPSSPDKYMNRDGVTNQYWLPHIGEVTMEVYWKIIKNTRWHKQDEVWPL